MNGEQAGLPEAAGKAVNGPEGLENEMTFVSAESLTEPHQTGFFFVCLFYFLNVATKKLYM